MLTALLPLNCSALHTLQLDLDRLIYEWVETWTNNRLRDCLWKCLPCEFGENYNSRYVIILSAEGGRGRRVSIECSTFSMHLLHLPTSQAVIRPSRRSASSRIRSFCQNWRRLQTSPVMARGCRDPSESDGINITQYVRNWQNGNMSTAEWLALYFRWVKLFF